MRYQLRRVIADGGAGRVYEALDTHRKLRVAVKILHPEVARDEIAVERFKRELEVSKLLRHDHVVTVHDFQAMQEGGFALVMDYLEGEELRSVLKREGKLSPARLVRMLSQVAIALEEAHQQQLVHRDLKPDNLFLCGTREGDIVKVLDFGSVRDNSAGAKKLTMMGTTIGSPYYMSPEQAQGQSSLDARADVWALAAIAYECLVGEVPFAGRNGPSILLAILTNQPVPASLRAQVPATVDDAIEGGLAKDPGARTATAGLFADAMGRAYGLEGDHRLWAYTEEAALAAKIEAALPGLLARSTEEQPAGGDDLRAMGLPSALPKWLLPAILGGAALALVGALIFARK